MEVGFSHGFISVTAFLASALFWLGCARYRCILKNKTFSSKNIDFGFFAVQSRAAG